MSRMNTIKVEPLNISNEVRPIWSVMIPTYNCSTYLKETIQSVLIQDRGSENMEIWVVDDHSVDKPEDIVKEYGNGRVNFYRQQQNVGQLNNFSTCLNLARGKLIHLLHGDDFVHPGFYLSLEDPLISDDSIGAAFCRNNVLFEKDKCLITSDAIQSAAGVIENFIYIIGSGQVIQTPSIAVKREVYEKLGGFDKNLSSVEDWEMWIRIACNYNFYYSPEIKATYRVHDNSNTENSIETGRFITDVLKIINLYYSYLKISKKSKKKLVASAKQHYLNYALQQSRERLSPKILFRSFSLVYNFTSFFQILDNLFKVWIKVLIFGGLALFVKNKVGLIDRFSQPKYKS